MSAPSIDRGTVGVAIQGTVLSVIVPTRNEAGNVAALVTRLDAALDLLDAEIVFVDDSDDDTADQIRCVATTTKRRVRLIHRAAADRTGGLGGAVLAGLQAARGEWAVVMDGDLQHPPETVPELLRVGVERGADLVVASRYLGCGSAAGLSSAARRSISGGGTRVTRTAFPKRLATCTDPMSGFFAVRRGAVDLDTLRPRGFKILLEIVARSPRLTVAEVPFTFQERLSGQSKASVREGALFLRQLLSLRASSWWRPVAPTVVRTLGFAGVGVTGVVVNSLALWLMVSIAGVDLLVGAALATQASTLWNYLLTDRLVFTGPKLRSPATRLLGFAAVNNAVLLLRLPLLAWLVHAAGVGYLIANAVTLLAAFVVRFLISDRYLFRPGAAMTLAPDRVRTTAPGAAASRSRDRGTARTSREARAGRPVDLVVDLRDLGRIPRQDGPAKALPFQYDVHGIVALGSTVALKELAAFRTDALPRPADIEVRRGEVGDGGFRRRTRVTQFSSPAAVSYQEHLGRLGSDFSVEMGSPVRVVVGPLLVRSPHVLYTNIVEALLRFVMVSRGYMLLHSACLELDGRGLMLTATGKTGTILRLIRENESRFLSDDMTILSPGGTAFSYPKPLTISQHTLRAVNAGDLTRKEWRRLRVQSRLHSKEGRGVGARLGEMNVPIMSLNAVTQYVVPPPKYCVDRLVPCEHTSSVRVEDLFIIERNEHALADLDPETMLDELIANTDDAYGFPPFAYFAPALVVDGMGYEELRAAERAILASALTGVRARRLATPDFTWADRIPTLVREDLAPRSASPATARAVDKSW